MAAIASISEATTVLSNLSGQLETVVKRVFERKDLIEDNKIQLDRVHRKFQDVQMQLPHATSFVAGNINATATLREMAISLKTEFERVVEMQDAISSARVIKRVKRMKHILDQCETREDILLQFLCNNVSPFSPLNSSSEIYVPATNVPPNPPRLTLDYANLERDEGKLRAAILAQTDQRVIAFIASGQGGVGKTCALRGLTGDRDLEMRFVGGLLYIQLGNDATVADIIQGLAKIVYLTGGKQLSQEIKSFEQLHDACDIASPWFASQSCLFLVDDLWKVNGIDIETIDILARIVNKNSRMVYTSRDKHFLNHAQKVIHFRVKKPDGELAREMLLSHSETSEHDLDLFSEKNLSAFEAILNECKGLPLALGIVGGAVLSRSRKYSQENKQHVWSDHWTDMKKCSSMYDFANSSKKEKVHLRRIVDLSLDVLDRTNKNFDYPFLFRALSVLRKQQAVPLTILRKMWNLKTLEETKMRVGAFYDVSVLQISEQGSEQTFVQLHDLVLDIAKYEASMRNEDQGFYNRLIDIYSKCGSSTGKDNSYQSSVVVGESNQNQSIQEERGRQIHWWNFPKDGYIHDNICSLLLCGGQADELVWLLSQPEWIFYRFMNGGVLQVEADLKDGSTALGTSCSTADQREHLEMVGKAVRLSRSFVHRNSREFWFQIYGRLRWHATINEWTRKFIDDIDRKAPRPWFKAPIGVLQPTSTQSQGILTSKGIPLCIRIEKGIVSFVWKRFREDGIGVTSWDINTEKENTIKLDLASLGEITWNKKDDCCAAFNEDGTSVIIADDALLLGVFKTTTGELKECHRLEYRSKKERRNIFGCCFASISKGMEDRSRGNRVVALSKNGKYVLTSNESNEMQMWSTSTGRTIGPSLNGHTGYVCCMTVNTDGSRVATGSQDGTVRVWDTRSGKTLGSPLYGHTDAVMCIAMNAVCSRIVSGSKDKSVWIWDLKGGQWVGKPLHGHTDSVLCVNMSGNGMKIVSGSWDKTVIVWDLKNNTVERRPLHGHTEWVPCAEMNENGDLVLSGSGDRTVRVWNTKKNARVAQKMLETGNMQQVGVMSVDGRRFLLQTEEHIGMVVDTHTGEAVGSPITFDVSAVRCMGVSADDSVGVFGLKDGNLIKWDVRSGKTVRRPLSGHTNMIHCLKMSADGNVIVSGSLDNTVRIWQTENGKTVGKLLAGHTDWVRCVNVSADGSRVVSGSLDGTVRIWDARSGEAIGEALRHTDWVYCVGLSADGTKLVSGSSDRSVRLWDLQSSRIIGGPFHHDDVVMSLGFDEHMSKIATICYDGSHKLWDVQSKSCVLCSSGRHWNSEMSRLSLSWNGLFYVKNITDVDENGNDIVLATTEIRIFNGPSGDIYFPESTEPFKMVRQVYK